MSANQIRASFLLSRQMKSRLRVFKIDYKRLIKDYLQSSAVHGCKHLHEDNRRKSEQSIWLVIMLLVFAFTIWVVVFVYMSFLNAPTATTELPQRKSVTTVPFPAVGVCDGNRISKKLLYEFAVKLFEKQNHTSTKLGATVQDVFNSLLFIGTFYNLDSDDLKFYELDRLHTFFTEIYNGTYSMGTLIRNLMYPCTDHLSNCVWQSQEIDCKKIFFQRKTYLGFCCLFNYQRPTVNQFRDIVKRFGKIPEATPMYVHGPGYEMGLTVTINHDPLDNAFFIDSNLGTHVFIFNPLDFADVASGAASNYLISSGQEMFISLHPQPVSGAEAMRDVPPSARGCQFFDENILDYNNYYSFSECNLVCNVESMIRACGCYPFFINSLYNVSECLISDVLCLQEHKNSKTEIDLNLKRDTRLTYQCPQCLPTCNYIRYTVQKSWGNIKQYNASTNITNKSVLRVYYGDSYVIEYQQTVVYTWYDLLSMLGGIVSVMIGASILSAGELIYFITGRFFTLFIHKYHKEKKNSAATMSSMIPETKIYFNDFNTFNHRTYKKKENSNAIFPKPQ